MVEVDAYVCYNLSISLLLLAAILTSALPVNVLAANETAAETAETWFVFDQDTNTIMAKAVTRSLS